MAAFIDALLGFNCGSAGLGVLGERVRSYSFHSEEQARGTLHFHGFVWLENRPSPESCVNLFMSLPSSSV